jgi:putative ABC transport system permease protein
MNFYGEIKMVIAGLRSRAGRSFLTILGIVIGVSGVVVIIALGAGAQSLVLGQINKIGTNLIAVLPGKSNENGPPAAVFGVNITTLTTADAQAMADPTRFSHIVAVSSLAQGRGTVVWRNESVDTQFTGTDAARTRVQTIPLESGRFFDEKEELAGNVMVLGYDVKQQLFGDDMDPLGEIVKIKNVPFKVIGVQAKQGTVAFQNQDDQVFIPLAIAQQQLLGIRHLQAINAKIDDAANVDATIADVTQLLRERHGIGANEDDDFSVRDLAGAIALLTKITDGLRLFLVAMAGLSLIVGGIGIMNIMLVTVAERTREIGLRKAVGATNSAVRNQFLLESSITTLLGGILGIALGAALAYLVALGARYAGYDWAFVISPVSVILALGVSALTGIVFGLYPAFKAAKLNPIDALRYE